MTQPLSDYAVYEKLPPLPHLPHRRVAYQARHASLGLCRKCPRPALRGGFCQRCWQHEVARHNRWAVRHRGTIGRQRTHWRAVRRVAMHLRSLGACVEVVERAVKGGPDLIVESYRRALTIAVRAATANVRQKRVVIHGKAYAYPYPVCLWNLHVHGISMRVRPDVWVLVPIEEFSDTIVIPDRSIGRRYTIYLIAHHRTERLGARRSRWHRWRGRWDVITGSVLKEVSFPSL